MKKQIFRKGVAIFTCFCVSLAVGLGASCGADSSSERTSTSSSAAIKTYNVTFSYNDGSGRKQTISIPEGETIDAYAPVVVEGNKEVIAWSLQNGGANYGATVTQDITLVAVWETHEIVEIEEDFPETLQDGFLQLNVTDVSELAGKTMRIGANVRSVSFVGDGTTIENFSLLVNERSGDLFVHLENFSYSSLASCGFDARNENENLGYTLNLNLVGANVIDCSLATIATDPRGADGLHAHELNVTGTGSLTVVAGNGVNGSNGTPDYGNEGTAGGTAPDNAQQGGIGIVADEIRVGACTLNMFGGNGGNGGKGGNGRNVGGAGIFSQAGKYMPGGDGAPGKNGGAAIQTNSFTALNTNLTLKGGNGGNGGHGGNGGGTSSTYAGKGGNGANGGNGGSIFASPINAKLTKTENDFTVGIGGSGGNGGASAASSKIGGSGSNGSDGVTNIN